MDTSQMLEQDTVTITLSRERYKELLDIVSVIGRDLYDLVNLEAVVNFYRDHQRLQTPLEDVLAELDNPSPSRSAWQRQAHFKHQDLALLTARLQETLMDGCLT